MKGGETVWILQKDACEHTKYKDNHHICSNGRRGHNYFPVQKDAASIRGQLPFEVFEHAHIVCIFYIVSMSS